MNQKIRIRTAIFAVSIVLQSTSAIALILSGIAKTFPQASASTVQMVYAITTVVGLFTTLLAGKLSGVFTKKKIVIVALIMELLGGIIGYFLGGMLVCVFAASILIGLGSGMVMPLASALIAEHFVGSERANVMGAQSLFNNGGSVLINLIGGILLAHYWRAVYLIFLLIIPIILVLMFLLPEGIVEKAEEGVKVKVKNRYLILLGIQAILFGTGWMTFMLNASLYVTELGIGGDGMASYLTMTHSIGSVLIGLLLAKILQHCEKYCFTLAYLSTAAGLWILSVAQNLPLLLVGSALVGIGLGLFMPSSFTLVPDHVNQGEATMAISIVTAMFYIGGLLSPYIITNLAALISGQVSTRFMLAAIVETINLIFAFICVKVGMD